MNDKQNVTIPALNNISEEQNVHEAYLVGLRGDCPHGMSGKSGGVCRYLHRPRCSTYMKWGDKNNKGCKKSPCDKLHPLVCPRSLDLKCLERNCDVKLHTRKCVRSKHGAGPSAMPGGQGWSGVRGHRQHAGVTQWRPVGHAHSGVPVHEQQPAPQVYCQPQQLGSFGQAHQEVHHQPLRAGHHGHVQQGAAHILPPPQNPWIQGKDGYNNVFQVRNPVQQEYPAKHPTGQQGWVHEHGHQHPSGVPNQQTVGMAASTSNTMGNPHFQTRCTPPSPDVHQILEIWAGNIQREMERQSEMNKHMLQNKMKEMCLMLGGQGKEINRLSY